METDKKEKKPIKPTFLMRAGEITLENGIDPCDIIFFHGRKNVQLSKVANDTYEIYINEE